LVSVLRGIFGDLRVEEELIAEDKKRGTQRGSEIYLEV